MPKRPTKSKGEQHGRSSAPSQLPRRAGTADRTYMQRAREKGDRMPQGTLTPAEWNAAHPNATDTQKRAFRDAYNRVKATLESRGYGTMHVEDPTSVGGTKGSKRPVDRSLAVKRAWETRKQKYGSSGKKG